VKGGQADLLVLFVDDNVVFLRSAELEKTKIRPRPVHPVTTLGVAVDQLVKLCESAIAVRAPIVHLVKIAVLEDRDVVHVIALPGTIADQDDFAWGRVMQDLSRFALEGLDQELVDEQLAARTDVHRVLRLLGPSPRVGSSCKHACNDGDNAERSGRSFHGSVSDLCHSPG